MNDSKIIFEDNMESLVAALKTANKEKGELIEHLIDECSTLEEENKKLKEELARKEQ